MKPKQFPAVFLFAATLCGASLFAQSNDNFTNRLVLNGTSLTTTPIAMSGATTEPFEPLGHLKNSIWYSWTAPDNLRVTLNLSGSTGSSYPRTFIYIGNTINSLSPVIFGNDQTLSWTAVKGVTYQIALDVGSVYTTPGSAVITLTSSPFGSGATVVGPDLPSTTSPANNDFINRKSLSGLPLTLIVYTGGATTETAEPGSGRIYKTSWYSYTATSDQWLTVSTEANLSASRVDIYHGNSFSTMQLVGTGTSESISVLMQKGTTYHIAIGNSSTYSTDNNIIQLAISTRSTSTSGTVVGPDLPTAATPANDNFANRKLLSGAKLSVFGYNGQATRESFEPAGYQENLNTLWYSWGTNISGNVTLTPGSVGVSGQTMGIYQGSDLVNLKGVSATQVGSSTNYTFRAEAGVTYHFTIGMISRYNSAGLVGFDLAGPGAGASAGDTTPLVATRLVNIATRAIVATGGSLNPGFVISGTTQKKVLIRGVGPGLAALGVPGTMSDPILTVYSGTNIIATNDNWSDTAANATALSAAFASVGAFALPANSKDAAVLLTLDPGAYTVLLKGVGGVGGDVIAEVYDVP